MRVSPAAVEVASQFVCKSVLSFAISRKNQYNSKHAMSEPNDAKSIAWTRFPLELDTFGEFATAVLQTLAGLCKVRMRTADGGRRTKQTIKIADY